MFLLKACSASHPVNIPFEAKSQTHKHFLTVIMIDRQAETPPGPDWLDVGGLLHLLHLVIYLFISIIYFFPIRNSFFFFLRANIELNPYVNVSRHFSLTGTHRTFNGNASRITVSRINNTCCVTKYNLDRLFVKLFQAPLI